MVDLAKFGDIPMFKRTREGFRELEEQAEP